MILVNFILAIGTVAADHICPHIPAVERFIRELPLGRDDR